MILSVELVTLTDEELVIHLYKLQALYRLMKTELYEVAQSTMSKSKSIRSLRNILKSSASTKSISSETEEDNQGSTPAPTPNLVAFEARFLKPLQTKIGETQAELVKRESRFRDLMAEAIHREGPPLRYCLYVVLIFHSYPMMQTVP